MTVAASIQAFCTANLQYVGDHLHPRVCWWSQTLQAHAGKYIHVHSDLLVHNLQYIWVLNRLLVEWSIHNHWMVAQCSEMLDGMIETKHTVPLASDADFICYTCFLWLSDRPQHTPEAYSCGQSDSPPWWWQKQAQQQQQPKQAPASELKLSLWKDWMFAKQGAGFSLCLRALTTTWASRTKSVVFMRLAVSWT